VKPYIREIAQHYTCEDEECWNYVGQCFVLDHTHFRLSAEHLRKWNIGIAKETSTLQAPEPALVAEIIRSEPVKHYRGQVAFRCEQPWYIPDKPESDPKDPAVILLEYIKWQKSRAPSYSSQLSDAHYQLAAECYDLATVRKLAEADWKDLDIPTGLGVRLVRDSVEFAEEWKTRTGVLPDGF